MVSKLEIKYSLKKNGKFYFLLFFFIWESFISHKASIRMLLLFGFVQFILNLYFIKQTVSIAFLVQIIHKIFDFLGTYISINFLFKHVFYFVGAFKGRLSFDMHFQHSIYRLLQLTLSIPKLLVNLISHYLSKYCHIIILSRICLNTTHNATCCLNSQILY